MFISDPSEESNHWIPMDAIKISVDFKNKHLPHVPTSLITEYLKQLNSVWLRREHNHVTYIKEKSLRSLHDLRRQVSQRVPYEEIVQRKLIDRLRSDLNREKERNNALMLSTYGKRDDNAIIHRVGCEPGLIETSFATIENLSSQIVDLHAQNQQLRAELMTKSQLGVTSDVGTLKQQSNTNDNTTHNADDTVITDEDKERYFQDGAAWFSIRTAAILDKLCAGVSRHITKYKRYSNDATTVIAAKYQKEMIEGIDQCVSTCLSSVQKLSTEANSVAAGDSYYKNHVGVPSSRVEDIDDERRYTS